MRLISLLLAITVLFLTAQPVCGLSTQKNTVESCCETGCADNDSPEKHADGADEDCDNCNPFQCCACCAGFVAPVPSFNLIADTHAQHAASYQGYQSVQLTEAPLSGIWQPPRQS